MTQSAIQWKLRQAFDASLTGLEHFLATGKTDPSVAINPLASDRALYQCTGEKVCRIGVFPFTANPMHWGHLIRTLDCIRLLKLDTLVVLPHGKVEHKELAPRDDAPAALRHQMVREVVRTFEPLLRYTDVALPNSYLGERNVHELCRRNPHLKAQWVCIWGAETCVRHEFILKKLIEYGGESGATCNPNHNLELAVVLGGSGTPGPSQNELSGIAAICGFCWPTTYLEDDPTSSLRGFWISSTDYRTSRDPDLVPPSVHATAVREKLYLSDT
jgi:hypothetical protein